MSKYTKQNSIIGQLLNLINQATHETNDTLIAKALLESRYQLENLSLDELSNKYYISQSTISRFIKKMGYNNYNTFKNAVAVSNYKMADIHILDHKDKNKDPLAIKQEVYDNILETFHNTNNIDIDHLIRIINIIKQYHTIIFLGSELSMAMCRILQLGLVALGKNVYTIYDLNYQEQIIQSVHGDSLVICISLEERWFLLQTSIEKLYKSNCYKILWTLKDKHIDNTKFNDVFLFGKPVKSNYGYNELMFFIMLVYRLIMNE